MKTKLFSLIILGIISISTSLGQVTLLSESFETSGEGTRYNSNLGGACNDFFDRVNAYPSCFLSGGSITSVDGSWYFAGEDVDNGTTGGGPGTITFLSKSISGYTNLMLSFKFGTPRAGYEIDDVILVQYSIDGGSFTNAIVLQGNPINGTLSGPLKVDTDRNPTGAAPTGADVPSTGVMGTYSYTIPGTGSNIIVKVIVDVDGGTEEIALDLVELKGTVAVNNPPVLSAIEAGAVNYTEGDPATQVTNTLVITDTESDNITSASVEVSLGFESGADVLSFTSQFGITGSQTGNTLSLFGTATLAQYQTVLRSVKFQNTNVTNISTTQRTIRFQVSDGGNSNYQTRNINITPTVNAPVALPICESFETDGEGTRYSSNTYDLGSDGTSCDFFIRTNIKPGCHNDPISALNGTYYWASEDVKSGNGNVAGSVQLSPLIATGKSLFTIDVLLGVSNNSGGTRFEFDDAILVQYNFDGGSWVTVGAFYGDAQFGGHMRQDADLNGTADPAGTFLTSTLQNFQFGFAGTGTNLNVRILVDQSGGSEEVAFDNICVAGSVPVNLAPVLANIEGAALNYIEGSGAQQVSNALTVFDAENDNITGATVVVFQGFDVSEDVLSFTAQFGVTGSYIGNTLTLTGAATTAEYQTLLRSVTYNNIDGTDPSLQNRTIQFAVTDGNTSNTQTRDVTIDASLRAAQALPFCESFETDGHGDRYSAYQFLDGSDFWIRHDNAAKPPSFSNAITGATGSHIWVAEDVVTTSNPNPINLGEMVLQPFVYGAATSFTVDVDLAVSSLTSWETTGDYLLIQYKMDAGSWITIGAFYGNSSGNFQEDTDLNGTPDGATLNNALTTYSFSAPASGANLHVRLLHDSDGNEELAFDNICVSSVIPPPSCSVTSITSGPQTACVNNQYTQQIEVTYSNAPAAGTLDVNGQSFAITATPQTVTLTNLTADGLPVNVTAVFSADAGCSKTETALFTSPIACPCNISALSVGAQTTCANNLYNQEVVVTYANAPLTGSLSVNGQSVPITGSPQTVTLLNLTADGLPVNVTAVFSTEASCTKTETALFSAPAACGLPPAPCAATTTFKLYGLNKLWSNAGANDPNMFYHGITQTKRIRTFVSGGVGPYSYAWSNNQGYAMINQSAAGNQIQLFEPLGPSYVVCTITDIGAGCTFKDSVFVDWTDVFYCGDITSTNAQEYWRLNMCFGGVDSCMYWNDAKAALQAIPPTATLGNCSTPKTNLPSVNRDFSVYPNPTNGIATVHYSATENAQATIAILDFNGRVISTENIALNKGTVEYGLDLSNLTNGLYFLQLRSASDVQTQKIQVLK